MSRELRRRALLQGGLAALFAAACGPGPAAPVPAPLPPLRTSPLASLVSGVGLRWMILASPRDLLLVPWIPPLLDVAVSGARFERFARATGVDLRALPEALVASFIPPAPRGASEPKGASEPRGAAAEPAPPAPDTVFYLVRHGGDPAVIERSFRGRLTSAEKRSVDRPDLVRVSGKIGRETHAVALLGRDVAGFQEGGSASRGPAVIAALLAEGRLKRARPALDGEPLRALAARLGAAPVTALAPGPFEGELARGMRGLLAAATAIGAALRPTARQGFALSIVVSGDFSASGGPASAELFAAWSDLAKSSLGHLLGLDAPLDPAAVIAAPDAVGLSVELSGPVLAEGLAKATASRVQDIFR